MVVYLHSAICLMQDGNDADEVCYNLLCPGFVQTNSQILLGGAFSNTADLDGKVMLVFIGKVVKLLYSKYVVLVKEFNLKRILRLSHEHLYKLFLL